MVFIVGLGQVEIFYLGTLCVYFLLTFFLFTDVQYTGNMAMKQK